MSSLDKLMRVYGVITVMDKMIRVVFRGIDGTSVELSRVCIDVVKVKNGFESIFDCCKCVDLDNPALGFKHGVSVGRTFLSLKSLPRALRQLEIEFLQMGNYGGSRMMFKNSGIYESLSPKEISTCIAEYERPLTENILYLITDLRKLSHRVTRFEQDQAERNVVAF